MLLQVPIAVKGPTNEVGHLLPVIISSREGICRNILLAGFPSLWNNSNMRHAVVASSPPCSFDHLKRTAERTQKVRRLHTLQRDSFARA